MSTILSFKDRGPWGDKAWRGNCSGHIYRELFASLKPALFVDPMVGSGTSVEVAQEMGIEAYGLDLHSGFDALTMSILERVGRPASLCVSHPPYGGMIRYSGAVWGDKPHPNDLSWAADDEDFHEKLQRVLLNQREAVEAGGVYGAIIGDWRQGGRYVSFQAEMIARMPAAELAALRLTSILENFSSWPAGVTTPALFWRICRDLAKTDGGLSRAVSFTSVVAKCAQGLRVCGPVNRG